MTRRQLLKDERVFETAFESFLSDATSEFTQACADARKEWRDHLDDFVESDEDETLDDEFDEDEIIESMVLGLRAKLAEGLAAWTM
jgi:phytoene dehydrogenase-like protein